MVATRNSQPVLKMSSSTESDFYGNFEKLLTPKKMVRTRKSAKEPRELQLEETPPETNGYHLNFANGDTESMETDEPSHSSKLKKRISSTPEKTTTPQKNKEKTMENIMEAEGIVEKEKSTEEPKEKVSMAVLLTQGLMANDASKVDTVLRENRLDLIQSTLVDLNVVHVIPLLKAIEHRLRYRVADIRPWLRWLQCTMSFHLSYLATQRSLDKEIASLLEWLRARSLHQQKLFQLHGKLGVLADQIEKRSNNTSRTIPQPLIIFNNDEINDSDVDELESIGSEESGASEDDWWDDKDIQQGEDDDDDDEEDDDEELEDIGRNAEHSDENEDGSGDDDEEDEDEDMEED